MSDWFSIGIDCEDIERWAGLDKHSTQDPRFPLFSASEHEYCSSFDEPAPRYAARWCAKEAARKALGRKFKVDLRKIQVKNREDGSPDLVFGDIEISKAIDQQRLETSLSIAHSRMTATAAVMVRLKDSSI